MANANRSSIIPFPKISWNLMHVAGILQDMQDMQNTGELQPMSPSEPPVAFIAGVPM